MHTWSSSSLLLAFSRSIFLLCNKTAYGTRALDKTNLNLTAAGWRKPARRSLRNSSRAFPPKLETEFQYNELPIVEWAYLTREKIAEKGAHLRLVRGNSLCLTLMRYP